MTRPVTALATQPRLGYVVARLDRALRHEIELCVRPHGLTVAQYTALSVLANRSGLSNSQLARRSYITPQSMSQVLAALEREGLVRRAPDPAHARILRAQVTAKGRRVLALCDEAVDEVESRMVDGLSEAERAQLLASLKHCVRTLRAGLDGL